MNSLSKNLLNTSLVSINFLRLAFVLHDLHYKITDVGVIFTCVITIGASENENDSKYFKWFYLEYVDLFESNMECKIMTFKHCSEFITVNNINWLHKRTKLFNSADKLYVKFLDESCKAVNVFVAEWFVDLYDEYELRIVQINEDNDDMDSIYLVYLKLSEEKIIYKKISQNKLTDHQKFNLLGINKFMHQNDETATCLVCLDRPNDLVKLSCTHYSCVTCLSTWFLNKDAICTYCKTPIEWDKCEKICCDMENVLENIDNTIKTSNEESNNITEKYNQVINDYWKN